MRLDNSFLSIQQDPLARCDSGWLRLDSLGFCSSLTCYLVSYSEDHPFTRSLKNLRIKEGQIKQHLHLLESVSGIHLVFAQWKKDHGST